MVIRHSEYKPLSVPRNEVLVSTPIVSIVQAWDHRVRSSRHQPWRTKFSSVTRTWKQRKRWLGHVRPVNRPQMALFQLFFFQIGELFFRKCEHFFFHWQVICKWEICLVSIAIFVTIGQISGPKTFQHPAWCCPYCRPSSLIARR